MRQRTGRALRILNTNRNSQRSQGTGFRLVAMLGFALMFVVTIMGAKAADGSCEEAIGAAARVRRVPFPLMSAIGLVESGRSDSVSGSWRPWPWTINAEGKGFFFNSKAEAIAAVRGLQADGVRSIDVGCMQINLMHHPDAFATLDEAFDPQRNALYAGRFLGELFQRSGDWMIAAGWYHSATTELAADYVRRVSTILKGAKLTLVVARNAAGPTVTAPIVGRDGMVLPSMRLTALGLILPHPIDRLANSKGRFGPRLGG